MVQADAHTRAHRLLGTPGQPAIHALKEDELARVWNWPPGKQQSQGQHGSIRLDMEGKAIVDLPANVTQAQIVFLPGHV